VYFADLRERITTNVKPMKKDLYIHIGPLKTGTSSLQTHCFINRSLLLRSNLLYPLAGLDNTIHSKAKHQLVVNALLQDEQSWLTDWMGDLVKESADYDRILISSEGFYNHFWDVEKRLRYLIETLNEVFRVHVLFFVRDLPGYFKSYYKQSISNPPINSSLGYGLPLRPRDFFLLPRIQQNLRFDEILKAYAQLLGKDRVLLFNYQVGKTVEAVMSYFDVPFDTTPLLNKSIPDELIPFLIEFNRGGYNEINRIDFIRLLRQCQIPYLDQIQYSLIDYGLLTDLQRLELIFRENLISTYLWPKP